MGGVCCGGGTEEDAGRAKQLRALVDRPVGAGKTVRSCMAIDLAAEVQAAARWRWLAGGAEGQEHCLQLVDPGHMLLASRWGAVAGGDSRSRVAAEVFCAVRRCAVWCPGLGRSRWATERAGAACFDPAREADQAPTGGRTQALTRVGGPRLPLGRADPAPSSYPPLPTQHLAGGPGACPRVEKEKTLTREGGPSSYPLCQPST